MVKQCFFGSWSRLSARRLIRYKAVKEIFMPFNKLLELITSTYIQ